MTTESTWTTYSRRKQIQRQMIHFWSKRKFHIFVTLNLNRRASYDDAREFIRHWLARVDSKALGRKWATFRKRRTFAVASLEHPTSNAHFHVLLRLPHRLRGLPRLEVRQMLSDAWEGVCPGGDLFHDPSEHTIRRGDFKRSTRPFASYTGKGWHDAAAFARMIVSTEFHADPPPRTPSLARLDAEFYRACLDDPDLQSNPAIHEWVIGRIRDAN